MHVFADSKGRRWIVQLDMVIAEQIKDLHGVNVYKLAEDKFAPLFDLLSDERTFELLKIVHTASTPETGAAVAYADFVRAMSPDTINEAALCWARACSGFFREASQRKALEKIIRTMEAYLAKARPAADAELETIDPETLAEEQFQRLKTALAESRAKTSSAGPGSAPASSASTPAA